MEIDARGAYVAPGFIDCHTHYDPSVWWDPLVDPMPQHGVTTVVTGNCSLSLSPVRAADRVAASDVFGFIEDIPVDAFATGIPWTWESYAEWRDVLRAHGTAVNIAALVGHSNLRVYVMGDDAWDRAATDDERARLATVLADSLAAGALGLSTSFIDQDRHGNAVPSRAADDAELLALVDVLGGAPGVPRVLEFLPWIKEIDRQLADIERVARWCGARGVSCTWNQLAENSRDPSRAARIIAQAHALHADGCRVYAQVSPRPFNLNVSFDQTPAFVAVPAWGELIAADARREAPHAGRRRVASTRRAPTGTASATASPSSPSPASTGCGSRRCAPARSASSAAPWPTWSRHAAVTRRTCWPTGCSSTTSRPAWWRKRCRTTTRARSPSSSPTRPPSWARATPAPTSR